jgi:BMFP domain-containing protein YqiC
MPTQRIQDETFEDLKALVDEEVRVDVERLTFDQLVGAALDVVVAHREEAQKYESIARRTQQELRDKEQRIEELEEQVNGGGITLVEDGEARQGVGNDFQGVGGPDKVYESEEAFERATGKSLEGPGRF